jgi:hypothetical protein
MGLDGSANHIQLPGAEAMITSKSQRLKPEFAGPALMFHMNVQWFIAVEAREKEPIRPRNTPDSRHSEASPPRTALQTIAHDERQGSLQPSQTGLPNVTKLSGAATDRSHKFKPLAAASA